MIRNLWRSAVCLLKSFPTKHLHEISMTTFANCHVFSFHSFYADFKKPLCPRFGDLVHDFQEPDLSKDDEYDRRISKRVASWVPGRLKPALESHYAKDAILIPNPDEAGTSQKKKRTLGTDLYVPLRRLLDGDLQHRCKVYELTERSKKFLDFADLYQNTPKEERYRYRLALKLEPAAIARLRQASANGGELPEAVYVPDDADGTKIAYLPIEIADFVAYHFATNRIICQVKVRPRVSNEALIPQQLFAELVDSLGRFPKLAWLEYLPTILDTRKDPKIIEIKEFTFGGLVSRLLFGGNAEIETSLRTYTHAYAQIADKSDILTRDRMAQIAARLARQYTSDYALSPDAEGIQKVADFDNVVHVVSREGSATLVDPRNDEKSISFLDEYLTTGLLQTYLPIVVLNLHQHAKALELSARSILKTVDHQSILDLYGERGNDEDHYEDIIKSWVKLQEELTQLNSRFRFHQVSQITMQNSFNAAMRKCLGLDAFEQQLNADISEMSNRMQTALLLRTQRSRREFNKRYYWLPLAVAGLASASIASDMIQAYNSVPDGATTGLIVTQLFTFTLFIGVGLAWTHHSRKKV